MAIRLSDLRALRGPSRRPGAACRSARAGSARRHAGRGVHDLTIPTEVDTPARRPIVGVPLERLGGVANLGDIAPDTADGLQETPAGINCHRTPPPRCRVGTPRSFGTLGAYSIHRSTPSTCYTGTARPDGVAGCLGYYSALHQP